MQKKILILSVILLSAAGAFAQTSVELIPTAGYTFADRNDFYSNYGRISDGLNLGGSVKFNFNRDFGLEILYSYMNANTGLYNYGSGHDQVAGGNLRYNYIMAGPIESFNIPNSTVRPFIGVLLGAAILSPDANNSGYGTISSFAAGFQLGTNIYLSPRVGIQLKAQLLSPAAVNNDDLYQTTNTGYRWSNSYASVYQFSLNAGLIIGLGRVLPARVYRRARRPRPRYYRYY